MNGAVYRWNMTHCATVTMLSCVSLSADNLARTPSSVYAITVYLLGNYGVNVKWAELLERIQLVLSKFEQFEAVINFRKDRPSLKVHANTEILHPHC